MAPEGPAFASIVAAFGHDIVAADGAIDRGKLAALVFADPSALARLEGIVHPAVYEVTSARVANSTAPVVVLEAIKLLEAGLSIQLCDQVWVVRCTEAEQLARLAKSRGMTADEVRLRRASQMPYEQMTEAADLVIDTNGTLEETEEAVLQAWLALGLPLPAKAEDDA
jgi:dephospho-CoA kinase